MPDTYLSFVVGYFSLWALSFALIGILLRKVMKLESKLKETSQI